MKTSWLRSGRKLKEGFPKFWEKVLTSFFYHLGADALLLAAIIQGWGRSLAFLLGQTTSHSTLRLQIKRYEYSTWNAGLDICCFANSKLKLKKRRSEGWEAHRFSDHEVVCQPETDAAICQESLATPLLILFKLHPHHDLSYGLDIHLEADHHHHLRCG